MKIGVFSLTLPDVTPTEAIPLIKASGFCAVEWRLYHGVPDKKPENMAYDRRYWDYNKCTLDLETILDEAVPLYTLCAENGLEVCSLSSYLLPHEHEEIEIAAKAAALMNCPHVRINAPVYDGTKNYWDILKKTKADMVAVQEIAKRNGVRIVIEQHMNYISSSCSLCLRIVEDLDPRYIGILLDPGNMVIEGRENFKMAIEILGDYLAHVHVKNAFLSPRKHRDADAQRWDFVWAPLDEGSTDIPLFIKTLKQCGYHGYVCLEDFADNYDYKTKLLRAAAFLKQILGEDSVK